jgi:hypothetical protein
MAFLYLVPTGMNDPNEPTWGSWAGRYGPNDEWPGKPYFWANQTDTWRGTTSRDHTLARWAADLQNDFRARLDWSVKPREQANHRPIAVVNDWPGSGFLRLDTRPGSSIELSAEGSRDPDGDALAYEWLLYGEAGTYRGEISLSTTQGVTTRFTAPEVTEPETIHVILRLQDDGQPALCSYRRVIITVARPADGALDFEKRVLTEKYYCDGINAGDFNRDGHMDVVAGPSWYEGPEFRVQSPPGSSSLSRGSIFTVAETTSADKRVSPENTVSIPTGRSPRFACLGLAVFMERVLNRLPWESKPCRTSRLPPQTPEHRRSDPEPHRTGTYAHHPSRRPKAGDM